MLLPAEESRMSARRIAAVGLSFLFFVFVSCIGAHYADQIDKAYGGPSALFTHLGSMVVAATILALAWRKHL